MCQLEMPHYSLMYPWKHTKTLKRNALMIYFIKRRDIELKHKLHNKEATKQSTIDELVLCNNKIKPLHCHVGFESGQSGTSSEGEGAVKEMGEPMCKSQIRWREINHEKLWFGVHRTLQVDLFPKKPSPFWRQWLKRRLHQRGVFTRLGEAVWKPEYHGGLGQTKKETLSSSGGFGLW